MQTVLKFVFMVALTGLMAMLPEAAQALVCGDTVSSDETLTADILSCPSIGLELTGGNFTLDCDGFTISGIGSGIGILLNNVSQVKVINCSVEEFAVGFRIDGGTKNQLRGNRARNNQSTSGGFQIINGSTLNVLRGNFSGFNVGRGFTVQESHFNTLVSNESFSNGFRGFDIINANYNRLGRNTAVNNGSAGIVVQDYQGGTSTGNFLYKEVIDGSASEGLAMFSSGNTVDSITSDNNGTWGIRDTSGGGNTYINNTCTGNQATSSPLNLCF